MTTSFGSKTKIFHQEKRDNKGRSQNRSSKDIWHTKITDLGNESPTDRTCQHRNTGNDLPFSKNRFEASFKTGKVQRINKPSFGCAGEKGKPKSQKNRSHSPNPKISMCLPCP